MSIRPLKGLDGVKKCLSADKLKLNPDKTEFIYLDQGLCMQNLANFSQLIYLVISFHLLRQVRTLVYGSIQIFPSLTMS